MLYGNGEVSKALRERFVLHWVSVRPVPRITVDFGDGRRIERTITGNAVHYVLDARGRVVDAIPGLYGPSAFLRELGAAEEAAKALGAMDDDLRAVDLSDRHARLLDTLKQAWAADLARAGKPLPSPRRPPDARDAARMAMSKGWVERPLLSGLAADAGTLEEATDDATWGRIAALHAGESRLDAASRELVRRHRPEAREAIAAAASKMAIEDPLARVVRSLEESLAEDSVRNEYLRRRRVHEWLAKEPGIALPDLNERIYAELFLTPLDDPWMGLAATDRYTGIEGEGLVEARESMGGVR